MLTDYYYVEIAVAIAVISYVLWYFFFPVLDSIKRKRERRRNPELEEWRDLEEKEKKEEAEYFHELGHGDVDIKRRQRIHNEGDITYNIYNMGEEREPKEKRQRLEYETSSLDKFPLYVGKEGADIKTKYCEVRIPNGALDEIIDIEMWPDFTRHLEKKREDGRLYISPGIVFDSSQPIKFNAKVTVSVLVNYTAADPDVPVYVKIERIEDGIADVIETIEHRQSVWITFRVDHFCEFCIFAEARDHPKMQRHFYSAICLSPPPAELPEYHILHWHIFDYCWNALAAFNTSSDASNYKVVKREECFVVKYGANVTLHIQGQDVEVDPDVPTLVNLRDKWYIKFEENFQFKLTATRELQNIKMSYTVRDTSQEALTPLAKHFFMDWKFKLPSRDINVLGAGACGIQANTFVPSKSAVGARPPQIHERLTEPVQSESDQMEKELEPTPGTSTAVATHRDRQRRRSSSGTRATYDNDSSPSTSSKST